MHRKVQKITAAALAACILCAPARVRGQVILQPIPARQGPAGDASLENDPSRPLPLVNADEDMADYLSKARELIGRKEYARAIEILQALLDRRTPCFVPTADGRRFISLGAMATAVSRRASGCTAASMTPRPP